MTMPRTTFKHLVLVVVILSCSVGILSGCFSLSQSPTAIFVKSPSVCYPLMPIQFDASASIGGDSEIVEYKWQVSDGAVLHGSLTEHKFQSSGEYTMQLQITTRNGDIASTTQDLTVLDALVVPGAFRRIQEAIDAAADGDVVVVLPGTYYVALVVRGKKLTIRSTDPENPEVVSATVLRPKPDSGRPIFTFAEYTTATLEGFTITGMIGCPQCATGAIYIRESSPIIRRNRIVGNREGGIVAVESGVQLLENEFSNNVCSISSISGGAINIYGCSRAPTISGNTFLDNTARSGGAIYVSASCGDLTAGDAAPVSIKNNVFKGNTATDFGGGAVFVEYGAYLTLNTPDNNTYSGNDPNDIFYVVPPK